MQNNNSKTNGMACVLEVTPGNGTLEFRIVPLHYWAYSKICALGGIAPGPFWKPLESQWRLPGVFHAAFVPGRMAPGISKKLLTTTGLAPGCFCFLENGPGFFGSSRHGTTRKYLARHGSQRPGTLPHGEAQNCMTARGILAFVQVFLGTGPAAVQPWLKRFVIA